MKKRRLRTVPSKTVLSNTASPSEWVSHGGSSYEGLQGNVRDLRLPRLETWSNEYPDREYRIRIEVPEFNCICPKTGLPDFATITIDYSPRRECVELKSLKLYITAFRNVGIFHEHAVNRILDDFVALVKPRAVEILGLFGARGGMTTSVRASWPRKTNPSRA